MRAVPAASRWVSSADIPRQRNDRAPRPVRVRRPRLRPMLVSVRLFAGLRERAGAARLDVELPDEATVGDLLAAMELAPRSCVAAINREYAAPEAPIAPGDEVALVPPVSGGDHTLRRI